MQIPTLPETALKRPIKEKPNSIALTQHSSGAQRRPLFSPRIDEQRVADLAHEMLAAAIKLAAMLEVAQQVASARRKGTADVAAVEGPGNA